MQKFSNGWNDLQNYSWPMGQVLFGRPHTVILYSILIMSLSRTISEIQPCHEHSFQLNMTEELVATCNAKLSITVRTMYVIYAYFYILALAWYLLTEMTFKGHSRSSTMYLSCFQDTVTTGQNWQLQIFPTQAYFVAIMKVTSLEFHQDFRQREKLTTSTAS